MARGHGAWRTYQFVRRFFYLHCAEKFKLAEKERLTELKPKMLFFREPFLFREL